MSSVKLRLKKNKQNAKGDCPIVVQIIHQKRSTEISTGKYVAPNQWDITNSCIKKTHPNATVWNVLLRRKVGTYQVKLDDALLKGESFTIEHITGRKKLLEQNPLLLDYLIKIIAENDEGLEFGTLKYYWTLVSRLKKFSPKMKLNEVDQSFGKLFKSFLEEDCNNAPNTVHARFKVLKKVLNVAVRDGLLEKNKLKDFKIKRAKTKRDFLTIDELKKIMQYDPQTSLETVVKDTFIFSCFTGLRFSDLCRLSKENILSENGGIRLYFTIAKTKEHLSFKLPKQAEYIAREYINKGYKMLFPIIKHQNSRKNIEIFNQIGGRNAVYNKTIKKICKESGLEKNISFHCARHSFATISLNLGMRIEVLSKLLGHQDIKVTQIYAKVMDEAKDKGMDLLNSL